MEALTIIVNDAPYGSERVWNLLRLASASASPAVKMDVHVFLLGDAVSLARRGQNPPEGHYNLEKMLLDLMRTGVKVRACGTCLRARGLNQKELIDGVEVGTMIGLAEWVKESHVTLSF